MRALGRMQDRMTTGGQELEAAARLIDQAGTEGGKRAQVLQRARHYFRVF